LRLRDVQLPKTPLHFGNPCWNGLRVTVKNPSPTTQLIVYLEYSNSSSNKYISEIFHKLEEVHGKKTQISVKWRYELEDDAILQLGHDFSSIFSLPFKFEEVAEARERFKKVKIRSKKTGSEAIISYRYWDAIVRNGHGDEYQILQEFS